MLRINKVLTPDGWELTEVKEEKLDGALTPLGIKNKEKENENARTDTGGSARSESDRNSIGGSKQRRKPGRASKSE